MKRMLLARLCALAGAPFLAFFAAGGPLLCAQTARPLYVQSFRQGPTHITEESFEARLDPQKPTYKEFIKDRRGNDRYLFTISPQGPQGDTKITSWQAKLTDLQDATYPNILLASPRPSSDPANNLWRLDPASFALVPVRATRIIKVDSFYVTLEVKAYHFTPIDSPYLDSMIVQVKFSNTDPRTEGP